MFTSIETYMAGFGNELSQYKELYSSSFSFVLQMKVSVRTDQSANTTNSMGPLT